jgi:hypothetical protein
MAANLAVVDEITETQDVELTKYLAEGPWKGRHGPQNIHNIAVITRPWQAQGQLDSLEPSRSRRRPAAGRRAARSGCGAAGCGAGDNRASWCERWQSRCTALAENPELGNFGPPKFPRDASRSE